jgi:5-methyltetrahydropteroyltriglutamate--homocysteine methyltransferase
MVATANLGFPRIGEKRELKKTLENFWNGKINEVKLQAKGKKLRINNLLLQQNIGIDFIPSNDFSFYDHVLDTCLMVGAIPQRFNYDCSITNYFTMARGDESTIPMEMTKWFDTNYHYIVPEFTRNQKFELLSTKIVDAFIEAKEIGVVTRPVLLGPVSFLLLGKGIKDPLDLLPDLIKVYHQILQKLIQVGAEWVQVDEPLLSLNLNNATKEAFKYAYNELNSNCKLKLLLTTYFGELRDNLDLALNLKVQGIHFDLVRGINELEQVLQRAPNDLYLSLGLIDGRNIWKNDIRRSLLVLTKALKVRSSDKLIIAPSCSLLHVPIALSTEKNLDPEIKSWLAFATEKLEEVKLISDLSITDNYYLSSSVEFSDKIITLRSKSSKIHNNKVKEDIKLLSGISNSRNSDFPNRKVKQKLSINLPFLPVTTIGSFPQTSEIRDIRKNLKSGKMDENEYESALAKKTAELIRWQEELGIDVLVHGEYERNDMVEFFGEKLAGYTFTDNGWVQSYGSRCVKPPIIYGDINRKSPLTLKWTTYAQSLTKLPVKGMLTGPVTMLQWSFVRDDQSREDTCNQIALALREEVLELETNGIKIIQIDEPALREGLPLRLEDRDNYLEWAVNAFKITSGAVKDETQIHTHMCYCEFKDVISEIAAMDADVVSIETSRSAMDLLEVFRDFKYPQEIGPGIWDIHSPRIPTTSEMKLLLLKAIDKINPQQLWVNPDCGLKTRGWIEVEQALINMVAVAKDLRGEYHFTKQKSLVGNQD